MRGASDRVNGSKAFKNAALPPAAPSYWKAPAGIYIKIPILAEM